MTEALGALDGAFRNAEGLPLELIASRLPEEEAFYAQMQQLVWELTQRRCSRAGHHAGQDPHRATWSGGGASG